MLFSYHCTHQKIHVYPLPGQPYVLELEPPALLIPVAVPLATDVRRRVKVYIYSFYSLTCTVWGKSPYFAMGQSCQAHIFLRNFTEVNTLILLIFACITQQASPATNTALVTAICKEITEQLRMLHLTLPLDSCVVCFPLLCVCSW